MDKNTVSPPAYSLYAMDLPPSYDEAVQMGKQVARTNQKLNDIPEQVTPGGLNPSQCPPDTINRDPATLANSEDSEDATKEQPQVWLSSDGEQSKGRTVRVKEDMKSLGL